MVSKVRVLVQTETCYKGKSCTRDFQRPHPQPITSREALGGGRRLSITWVKIHALDAQTMSPPIL